VVYFYILCLYFLSLTKIIYNIYTIIKNEIFENISYLDRVRRTLMLDPPVKIEGGRRKGRPMVIPS
jgi:hypothetical protein